MSDISLYGFFAIEYDIRKASTHITTKDRDLIYSCWEDIPEVPQCDHDEVYLKILKQHGFDKSRLLVPLKARYTKGRRWSKNELLEAIESWQKQKSITFVAACLNRNPQDMIYKLLDYCKSKEIEFTQKHRSENSVNWNEQVKICAEELFENGLPAWKIATIFRVDFEHVEKELFVKRNQYGHKKKNPFGINTDHKQLANSLVLKSTDLNIQRVFEPFAGEGRFTQTILKNKGVKEVVCIEQDKTTFETLKSNVSDQRAMLLNSDNVDVIGRESLGKFDLVDLDPFVTCHQQIINVWPNLNDEALLFLTFGGEYRRSFIKTNRQSIAARYGFIDKLTENKEYLEIVPYFFLGYVAKVAAANEFTFNVIRAVRYANNCRFWLQIRKTESSVALHWLSTVTSEDRGGFVFETLKMPRFKEIRAEIDKARATGATNG